MAGDRFAGLPIGQELAASNLYTGSGVTYTVGPIDMLQWGGLVAAGITSSNNWDQQCYAIYEGSIDSVNWVPIVRLPIWPGLTLNAQLPRIQRYARLRVFPYGGVWDANAQSALAVRPTLTEILSIIPSLSGPPPQWTFSLNNILDTIYWIPGDLVAAIDWQVQNASASVSTMLVSAVGKMIASAVASTPFQQVLNSTQIIQGRAIKGTFAEPFPAIAFDLGTGANITSGLFTAIPLIRAGPPDAVGQPFDAIGAATFMGLLKNINQDADLTVSNLGNLNTLVTLDTGRIVNRTVFAGGPTGAGAWVTTGTVAPANEFLVSGMVGLDAVGVATDFRLAFGTAGAVSVPSAFYSTYNINNSGSYIQFGAGYRSQVPGVGNNTIWIFTNVAHNFSGILYTSPT